MKKNIIITILAVLVVGLGCFIVYDKVIDKHEEKKNNNTNYNEEKEELVEQEQNKDSITIEESEVEELVSKYYEPIRSIFDGTFGNKEKTIMALRDYRVNQEHISCDDISGVEKEITYNNTTYYCDGRVMSYNDVLTIAHDLFGNDVEVLKENVADAYILFNYNSKIDKYIIFTSNRGAVIIGNEAIVNKYYTEGNKLIALVDIDEKSYAFEFIKNNDSYVLNNIH